MTVHLIIGSLVVLQVALASLVVVHALLQLALARGAARRADRSVTIPEPSQTFLPRVTVQLPIFNEGDVAARLIDHVAALHYPADRLEVQVLDDSTDETSLVIAERLARLRASGMRVHHVRRPARDGFKAGALAHGLASASGDLIAIFDADFMPDRDFLLRTIPPFAHPAVALVQARWAYANPDATLLTKAQAFLLDLHFTIEQEGRQQLGCFINFNGTAAVWRAAAIRDAGGWTADTLTEDLDLSYRAQLRGWRFVYLGSIECRSELPQDMRSFRIQQFRWMNGVAQNARCLLPRVLRAPLGSRVKVHACAHLLESGLYLPTLGTHLATLALIPLHVRGLVPAWLLLNPVFAVAAVLLMIVYLLAWRDRHPAPGGAARFLLDWIRFFLVCAGISAHNGLAALSGYLGWPSPFERTPKRRSYVPRGIDRVVGFEVIVWLGFAAGLGYGWLDGVLRLLALPVIAFVGLSFVIASVLWEGVVSEVTRFRWVHSLLRASEPSCKSA